MEEKKCILAMLEITDRRNSVRIPNMKYEIYWRLENVKVKGG
jgi:hypothetical protein